MADLEEAFGGHDTFLNDVYGEPLTRPQLHTMAALVPDFVVAGRAEAHHPAGVGLGLGAARAFPSLLDRRLDYGQICQHQFCGHRLQFTAGVRVGAAETPKDDAEGIGFTERCDSLCAGSAARNIDETDLRRNGLLRSLHLGEDGVDHIVQPGVGEAEVDEARSGDLDRRDMADRKSVV